MALNYNVCAADLKVAIEALTEADLQDVEKIQQTLMKVLFEHFQNYAEVNTVVTGSADLSTGDVDGSGEGGIT